MSIRHRGGGVMEWKDAPYLFCNGKFRVLTPSGHNSWLLAGSYINRTGGYSLQWENTSMQLVSTPVNECTLIARRIEDITDEEFTKAMNLGYVDRDYMTITGHEGTNSDKEMIESLSNMAFDNDLPSKCFLYLLSIGVYPFDQSHFEPSKSEYYTGDTSIQPSKVIDIKTLEKQP